MAITGQESREEYGKPTIPAVPKVKVDRLQVGPMMNLGDVKRTNQCLNDPW